jgi:hypothetical protein
MNARRSRQLAEKIGSRLRQARLYAGHSERERSFAGVEATIAASRRAYRRACMLIGILCLALGTRWIGGSPTATGVDLALRHSTRSAPA